MAKNLDGKEFKFPKYYKPQDAFYNISRVALEFIKGLRKARKMGHPSKLNSIKEWNTVLDNIIFYLEYSLDIIDTRKFYKGKYKTVTKDLGDGTCELIFLEKPKLINPKGLRAFNKRVDLGKKQFFEFFENLWD